MLIRNYSARAMEAVPDIEEALIKASCKSRSPDLAHGIDKKLPTFLIVLKDPYLPLFHTKTQNLKYYPKENPSSPYNGRLSTPRLSLVPSIPRSSTENVVGKCLPTISWTWTDDPKPMASFPRSFGTTSRIFQYVFFFFVLDPSFVSPFS